VGDEDADAASLMPFGSAEEIGDQEREERSLVWTLEGGTWQLVSESATESEFTRAFRRKARFSLEYTNAYLYLRRIGQTRWLQKFDALEEWLEQHPGEFLSLPRYPSRHAKDIGERRLGAFVEKDNFLKRHDVEQRESAYLRAKFRLLSSLDGWLAKIASQRHVVLGRCAGTWAVMFEELQAWRREHQKTDGTPQQPRRNSQDPQEKRLAIWLKHQCQLRRQGKLEENRQRDIEGESMQESRWERSFFEAEFWFTMHPCKQPCSTASDGGEKAVAQFLRDQTRRWPRLSTERRRKLNATDWWVQPPPQALGGAGGSPPALSAKTRKKRPAAGKLAPSNKRSRLERQSGKYSPAH